MFKDKYLGISGQPFVPSDFARKKVAYYSSLSTANGDGSHSNPAKMPATIVTQQVGGGVASILSGGHFGDVKVDSKATVVAHESVIGQGMFNTYINNAGFAGVGYFNIKNLSIAGNIGWGSRLYMHSCRFLASSSLVYVEEFGRGIKIYDCLFNIVPDIPLTIIDYVNFSYANVSQLPLSKVYMSSNAIADKCDIIVGALGAGTGYINFSNCRFKIGTDAIFTALTGVNSAARRAEFIARCTAQGIACPTVSDLGVSAKLQRWDFEDDSVVEGAVIEGSELDIRNNRRGFYMGYTKPIRTIPLSLASTPKGHVVSGDLSMLEFKNNEIYVGENVNMQVYSNLSFATSVIPLGGRMAIDTVAINHTFSSELGLHFRRKDYDNESARHVVVGLRIVDALPPLKITTETLRHSFYYLVAYDDKSISETGYIEYDGANYYCGDTIFVRKSNTNCVIPSQFAGKVHLRECWHASFSGDKNPNNESGDFWNMQNLKPNYMTFVADDIRAQFTGDNENSGAIKKDNSGNFLTSAHPDFYPQLVSGIPAFPLYGAFVQLFILADTGNEQ